MNITLTAQKSSKVKLIPLRITLIYALVGGLWVLLSDKLLSTLVTDPTVFTELGILKGWLYVLATAAMLYALINRDVTKIRHSERALRESEQRLRLMVENLPVGALYREGDSILLNKASEKITGYMRLEINTIDKWFATLYGKEAGTIRSYYEEERSANFPTLRMAPLIRKDGEIRFVEFGAYRYEQGEVWLLNDVTERKQAEEALQLQIKQLTFWSDLRQFATTPGLSLKNLLEKTIVRLPMAFRYPEIISVRIILDGHSYSTSSFPDSRRKHSAELVVRGKPRGIIEVALQDIQSEVKVDTFLEQERSFINSSAHGLALLIERIEDQQENTRIHEQLRHADRLATIGQLAAGVAHEINEPLANILGFAQLAKKNPRLPDQAGQDIDKIVASSLHAREIIKKLMIFARQMPTSKTQVNLNKLVKEGPYFLESRCAKQGVELLHELVPNLPDIPADATQLQQVLVNLIVNALQAMPNGGRLTLKTLVGEDHVALIVEDTGIGMSEEVKKQIFAPFFTTKDIGEGTGLGLAVVHGIVTSHGGKIRVESEVGKGTRFEIRLPINAPN